MYRLEAVVFLLASLPLIMACIYAIQVAPRRKNNMRVSLEAAARSPETFAPHEQQTTDVITQGAERVQRDFESLYSSRLLIPAALLSTLYALGFSLGLSLLIPTAAHGVLIRPFTAFSETRGFLLGGPAFAMVGAYTFNAGVLVRRAYISDFSKNVMWACLNRLILSVGFSVFLYTWSGHTPMVDTTRHALCFAIAFFPGVFVTALRKRTRKTLGVGAATCELDIQLIQGIDVWKEERLSEEGIESVQNMATADIFGLLPKVHYPLRTIVDWMDQAIFIQRFPVAYLKWQQAGFAISAIRFAAIVDPSLTGAAALPSYPLLPHAEMQPEERDHRTPGGHPTSAQHNERNEHTLTSATDDAGVQHGQFDAHVQHGQSDTGVQTNGSDQTGDTQLPADDPPYTNSGWHGISLTGHAALAAIAPPQSAQLYSQDSIITGQPAPDLALLKCMAEAAAIELPVLREALTSLSNDAAIRVLARLWQSGAVLE